MTKEPLKCQSYNIFRRQQASQTLYIIQQQFHSALEIYATFPFRTHWQKDETFQLIFSSQFISNIFTHKVGTMKINTSKIDIAFTTKHLFLLQNKKIINWPICYPPTEPLIKKKNEQVTLIIYKQRWTISKYLMLLASSSLTSSVLQQFFSSMKFHTNFADCSTTQTIILSFSRCKSLKIRLSHSKLSSMQKVMKFFNCIPQKFSYVNTDHRCT